jgi:tRNA-dihydrouridine synthase
MNEGKVLAKPSIQEVIVMILLHARMAIEYKSEFTAIHEMRKHVAWYTHGYPCSTRLRGRVNEIETYEDLESLMDEYLELIDR